MPRCILCYGPCCLKCVNDDDETDCSSCVGGIILRIVFRRIAVVPNPVTATHMLPLLSSDGVMLSPINRLVALLACRSVYATLARTYMQCILSDYPYRLHVIVSPSQSPPAIHSKRLEDRYGCQYRHFG